MGIKPTTINITIEIASREQIQYFKKILRLNCIPDNTDNLTSSMYWSSNDIIPLNKTEISYDDFVKYSRNW